MNICINHFLEEDKESMINIILKSFCHIHISQYNSYSSILNAVILMTYTIIFSHIFFEYKFIFLSFCLWYGFAFISIETYTEVFKEDGHCLDCARTHIQLNITTYIKHSAKITPADTECISPEWTYW